jgi:hypothetical protein
MLALVVSRSPRERAQSLGQARIDQHRGMGARGEHPDFVDRVFHLGNERMNHRPRTARVLLDELFGKP